MEPLPSSNLPRNENIWLPDEPDSPSDSPPPPASPPPVVIPPIDWDRTLRRRRNLAIVLFLATCASTLLAGMALAQPLGGIEVQEETPVTHAHTETGELPLEFLEWAGQGICAEFVDGGEDEPLVFRNETPELFFDLSGDVQLPGHRGARRRLGSRPVQSPPVHGGARGPRRLSA